jgi:phosphopantetheinyl transferase
MSKPERQDVSVEIDLWLASETAASLLCGLTENLTDRDWDHINSLRAPGVMSSAIASRVLLRVALASATGGKVSPKEWEFGRTALGKPFVERGPDVHFSITYAGSMIAIGISRHCPIGLDIEPSPPRTSLEGMQTYLHPKERRSGRLLPRKFKESAFLRFWTLKEAFAKSIGEGLNLDFASIDLSSVPVGKAFLGRVIGHQTVFYASKLRDWGLSAGGWLSFAIMPPKEIPAFALTLHRLEAESGLVESRERRTLIVGR